MASEAKEDCVHFLVLTDVCGNRTYGVVAQFYRPLHVGDPRDGAEVFFYCGEIHRTYESLLFIRFTFCLWALPGLDVSPSNQGHPLGSPVTFTVMTTPAAHAHEQLSARHDPDA